MDKKLKEGVEDPGRAESEAEEEEIPYCRDRDRALFRSNTFLNIRWTKHKQREARRD